MTKILIQAVMLLMLLSPPAPGQAAGPDAARTAVTEAAPAQSIVERLVSISGTAAEERSHLGELERRLAETTDAVERKEIEAEMETTRGRIAKLNAAFEEAVTGGITAAALVDEPAERIIWRAELE